MSTAQSAFTWLVGWIVVILVLAAINRTVLGNKIVYYSLWLGVLFLLVTNYRFFAEVLNPSQQGTGTFTASASASTATQRKTAA